MKPHWSHSPKVVDRLAAEYALGTLTGRARRRFERAAETAPELARVAASWGQRLLPLALRLTPQPVDPDVWRKIEARVGSAPRAPAAAPAWWRRWIMPIPTAALTAGLMLGILLPTVWQAAMIDSPATQLPASYVGVLATADRRPGLVVSSLRHGHIVDLRRLVAVPVPPGQTLFLWWIGADGSVHPVAAVPDAPFASVKLDATAEAVFSKAIELAVSIEPAGSQPAAPTTGFVYRGPCGKLWPPPSGN